MKTRNHSALSLVLEARVRPLRHIGLVGAAACLLAAVACGSAPGTTPDPAAAGGAADGGAEPAVEGGSAANQGSDASTAPAPGGNKNKDAAGPPAGCDLSKDPKDSPPCVVDSIGVFVDAASGLDTNDGSRAHPLAHIQAALGKGKARVYVCAGNYSEQVKVTAGVGIFGGFRCTDFSYDASVVAIAPSDAGYAVEIADVKDDVRLEDLSITALPGTAALPSSVAVFAHGSAAVTLKRAVPIAGDGYAGTSSTAGSNYVDAQAPNGNLGSFAGGVAVAGLAPTCACVNGVKPTAGRGYGVPLDPVTAREATPGTPAIAGSPGGAAGVFGSACNAGGAGQDGASGAQGSDGSTPTTAGALSANGWSPKDGSGGTFGGPGQGGGGGTGHSSSLGSGAGGGSGACGGCGGAAATTTTGGGGSIALLSFESATTLITSSFTSGSGGDGGNGAPGQVGEAAGTGGPGASTGGCNGGNGGKGGNGGASAGGAGGVTFGVLYLAKTVKAPVVDGATIGAITNGAPGIRGNGGAAGKDGVAILAQKIQDAAGL